MMARHKTRSVPAATGRLLTVLGACMLVQSSQASPRAGGCIVFLSQGNGSGAAGEKAPAASQPAQDTSVWPGLSYTASSPRWVKPGDRLEYILHDIGRFETPAGGTAHNIDPTCRARPLVLCSLQPGSIRVETAVAADGGRLYRISGTARKEPGIYVDTWAAYNAPTEKGAHPATPQPFGQTVIISSDPRSYSPVESDPPLPKNLTWQAVPPGGLRPTGHNLTIREQASARLLPKLTARLTEAQRADLKNGREVLVPILLLPEALRQEAVEYIISMYQEEHVQYPPEEVARFNENALVILPAPAAALGVSSLPVGPRKLDGVPSEPSGSQTHF